MKRLFVLMFTVLCALGIGMGDGIALTGEPPAPESVSGLFAQNVGAATKPQADSAPHVAYRTHVQTYGWQSWVRDGAQSGTTGQSKRLEGIHISIADAPYPGGIEYRTHVQTYGWQDWVRDGQLSGTTGQSKRLEALQVRLYGQMAQSFDVYYRVHCQSYGWMGWASNGQEAGSEGLSKRLEAVQIVLVRKGNPAPKASHSGVTSALSEPFVSSLPIDAELPVTDPSGAKVRGPREAGALRVVGNKLIDKNERPIQLTGVSTHGLAWFPDYVNDACFRQLRTQWNANVVRLAMYTDKPGGYCADGDKNGLKELVKSGVRYATDNDLYVIVDWHILSDGNPLTHASEAEEFFGDISETFANHDNVIYEICNEPNGTTTWDEIKSYAEGVIPVIRGNDPDAIVIVGTPTWSLDVHEAAESPLAYDNVMYALHFYAATHKDDLRDCMVRAVEGGLPVFVSEFGICEASGSGAIDEASANAWIDACERLGVSWCLWSLCNKSESASIIQSGCNATSDFAESDLAASGTWLLKALSGSPSAGSDAPPSGSAAPPSGGESAKDKTVNFTSGQFACTATQVGSWPAEGERTCHQYELSIRNTGTSCPSWAVTMDFGRPISLANGWNGTFATEGSRLTIRSMDYDGSIAAGATLTGVGFQVVM